MGRNKQQVIHGHYSPLFHLFTDSNVWSVFETQPYPVDGLVISDIPHWVGSRPLEQRLSKEPRPTPNY